MRPEVRGGTQNAIIQKITERLSHHSAGQSFRNPIIFSQLRATEKPMFSEGGNKVGSNVAGSSKKSFSATTKGDFVASKAGKKVGPLGIPTNINQMNQINQTGFAYSETGLTLSPLPRPNQCVYRWPEPKYRRHASRASLS